MSHLFFLMLNSLLALFFILLGLLCLLLPWSTSMRQLIIQFLEQNGLTLFLFGAGLLAIGGALLTHLLLNARRRTYSLRMGPHLASVDTSLVEAYLREYFTDQYPKREIPCRVSIKRHSLQINANLPEKPVTEQKELLHKIERDLQDLFASRLGYHRPLHLFISFGE